MAHVKNLVVLVAAAIVCTPAFAMTSVSVDFDGGGLPAGTQLLGNAQVRSTDGNPGGYLSLTDALNGQRGSIIFPDFTGGQTLTDFKIEADLRIGGGTSLPADGISLNLVRPGDPVLDDGDGWASTPSGESNVPEEGTTTGLAIAFDEWQSGPAGNPDSDVVGVSVRVDNVLVHQIELPTRNGTVDDITSIQTGPNTGGLGGLGWAPVSIMFAADQTLTISYKNSVLFNQMIAMAPIAGGQLVIGSRTGGANSNHHVDNLTFMANNAPRAIPEPLTATLGLMAAVGVLNIARRRRVG